MCVLLSKAQHVIAIVRWVGGPGLLGPPLPSHLYGAPPRPSAGGWGGWGADALVWGGWVGRGADGGHLKVGSLAKKHSPAAFQMGLCKTE